MGTGQGPSSLFGSGGRYLGSDEEATGPAPCWMRGKGIPFQGRWGSVCLVRAAYPVVST